MSTAKSQDHWKALALLLDVTAPEEPEGESAEEAVASKMLPEADSEEDLPVEVGDLSPEASATFTAPLLHEPSVPTEQPPRSRPSRRPPAARVDDGHWRGLAGELGIEVQDEEPEEVEQLVVASEFGDESAPFDGEEPVQTLVTEQWADADVAESEMIQPVGETPPQPVEDAEPPWFRPEGDLETEAQFDQLDADDQPPPPAPAGRVIPSLFDNLNFSIDTPGALDRIFDEQFDEDERPSVPAGFEEREAYSESDDESDDSSDLGSFDDDEDTDESEDTIGASAPAATDTEERPRRRRRRRRRKKTTKEAEGHVAEEEAEEEAEDGGPPDEEPGETATGDQDLEELSHDDEHPDEDDDDDLLAAGVQHRKIPTWDEAVSVVISANMDSRAKNPGSASRGRGRGRGRRS